MRTAGTFLAAVGLCVSLSGPSARAEDWPQWRGPGRDAKVSDFRAPAAWPKELKKVWTVTVGQGDDTPALVGDRLYVFGRQGGDEVALCLEAATGKEVWRDKYASEPSTGASGRHPGPRGSIVVAGGKVVTFGVRGILSSLDAATGKPLWRKDEFPGRWPQFFTAASPIVVDGLCVAFLGGKGNGALVAFDLATGAEKWRWAEEGPEYSSPVVLEIEGTKQIVVLGERSLAGVGAADGKLLWKTPFVPQGRSYNACTPIVDGATVYVSSGAEGTKAFRVEKGEGGFSAKELWKNPDVSVQFNTPVLKDGRLYGISARGDLFSMDAKDGRVAWTKSLGARGGFGSVVDAGTVLAALAPSSELVFFRPDAKEYAELARYKVSGKETYAYPVLAGSRIFVRDQDSVTLWTIE